MLGSSVCTICKTFSELDNETFRSLKISALGRKFLERVRRHAAVELMRFGKIFVQQRFRSEHAEIGKRAASEQHGICSNEAIIADAHGSRPLPALLDVDRVRDDLRLKSCYCCKLTDCHQIRAVDQMPMCDGGVFPKD